MVRCSRRCDELHDFSGRVVMWPGSGDMVGGMIGAWFEGVI